MRIYGEMARDHRSVAIDSVPAPEAMRDAVEQVCANWRAHPAALRTFRETAMVSAAFGRRWHDLEHHVARLTQIVESERTAGRAAATPPDAQAIASAWFWMFEHQPYTVLRRDHTAPEEADLTTRPTPCGSA